MYSRQIESFIQIARAGSFSEAARQLYIAPSSLIQQVDLLEHRLGIKLFNRNRKGVTLTEAGESLFADAVEIVRLSNEAVARALQIQNGEGSIRVATSLLTKCRLLPSIWSHMIEASPQTRIDIFSLESAGVEPGNYLFGLGSSYDVMEGLYMSELYRDHCTFLELQRSPLCITLPRGHLASEHVELTSEFLGDLDVITLVPGMSAEYDAARSFLYSLGVHRITEIPHYTMDVFADVELNNRAIVSPEIWKDLYPHLVSIPLGPEYFVPYGLIFPKRLSKQVLRLYKAALAYVDRNAGSEKTFS